MTLHVLWAEIWPFLLYLVLPLSLLFVGMLSYAFYQMKYHPVTGKIFGKIILNRSNQEYFILFLQDHKQIITKVRTTAAKWANAQIGDQFTVDMDNGDGYWLSN